MNTDFQIIGGLSGGAAAAVIIIAAAVSYFLGNINPAALQAKAHGIDIKKEGTGNAGTTNVTRVLGPKAGLITLVVDIMKGVAAVLIGRYTGGEALAMICGLAVFLGHVFPVVYKFKGGKGVATAFGALTAIHPAMGLLELGLVVLGVATTRRMSAGSVVGAVCFPFVAWYFQPDFMVLGMIFALVVFFKHWGNIVRMWNGEEPVLSFKKKEKTDQ